MFTIRRKKKDIQAADPTKSFAHAVLKTAVLHLRWQEMLVNCAASIPKHRPALTPLIEAALTPPGPFLIEHAR